MAINQEIFEAFLKCPTKSQLSRDASVVVENSVAWPQEIEQIFIRNGLSRYVPAFQQIRSSLVPLPRKQSGNDAAAW
jgi:hypothetical protein